MILDVIILTAILQVIVVCDSLRDKWLDKRKLGISRFQWHLVKWLSFYSLPIYCIVSSWQTFYIWYWPVVSIIDWPG